MVLPGTYQSDNLLSTKGCCDQFENQGASGVKYGTAESGMIRFVLLISFIDYLT